MAQRESKSTQTIFLQFVYDLVDRFDISIMYWRIQPDKYCNSSVICPFKRCFKQFNDINKGNTQLDNSKDL